MIGDRVRALREQRGWTQSHLAEASGVSARTIQRVESKHAYSGETAMALAAALGIDVANLVAPGPAASGEHRPLWPAPSPQAAAVLATVLALPGAVMLIAVLLRNAGMASGPMVTVLADRGYFSGEEVRACEGSASPRSAPSRSRRLQKQKAVGASRTSATILQATPIAVLLPRR